MIALEAVGGTSRLYWRGWRPIWISRIVHDKNGVRIGGIYYDGGIKLMLLRGTFEIDKLLTDATAQFNRLQAANDDETRTRYRVTHFFRTVNKPVNISSEISASSCGAAPSNSHWDPTDATQQRILQWRPNDLGTSRMNHGNALAQQALSPAAKILVQEVRHWKTSEDW